VVRQAGWTVCHYLFFYAMNDWRSTFAGANDHEADWEQCFVFLEEADDGSATPVWFARAAHDEVGADLRRRWDDPLLVREGGDFPRFYAEVRRLARLPQAEREAELRGLVVTR